MAKRRDRVQIYAEILKAISQECQRENKAKITRVQYKVGVPFDRFKGYMGALQQLGFIEGEGALILTERGKEFLSSWNRVLETLNEREEGNGISTGERNGKRLFNRIEGSF
jgi:predicted transcriptional regulator